VASTRTQLSSINWSWVAPFVLALALTFGGWEWFFGVQSSGLTRVQERVTMLENTNVRADDRARTMADQISSMKPMLEFLVKKAQ